MGKHFLIFISYIFFSQFSQAQSYREYRLPEGTTAQDYHPGIIVVKTRQVALTNGRTKSRPLEELASQIGAIETKPALTWVQNARARKSSNKLSSYYKLKFASGADVIGTINQLLQYEEVEYAEPYFKMSPLFIPNDPEALAGGSQYYLEMINAFNAWTIEKGERDITIGVLDTGADLDHEDLINNISYNKNDPINGIDDDGNGLIDDFAGWDIADNDNDPSDEQNTHGSNVAGICAAQTNNATGMAGTGFRAKFLPIKIFESLNGGLGRGYEGIALAADLGCDVINLSWGQAGGFSQFGQDMINYAVLERDVVVVAAAGNTHAELDFYPASFDNVLSVGATDIGDNKASWATYSTKIDLMAPGNDILSTANNGGYSTGSGTSFSSPMVAGTAALVRARFPDLNARQVMERIRVTTDDIYDLPGNAGYFGLLGKGRLNMLSALTDNSSPAVRAMTLNYDNGSGAFAYFDDTIKLTVNFKNFLFPTSNARVSLSCHSPYVVMLDSTFELGALGTLDSVHHTFTIYLKPEMPYRQKLRFRLDIEDGIYEDFQYLEFFTSPHSVDLKAGDLELTLVDRGDLGYVMDGYKKGLGLRYRGENLLHHIGLITATSASAVSDNVVKDFTLNTRNYDFDDVVQIKLYNNSIAYRDVRSTFEEVYATIGIRVEQKALAWENKDFILLEYRVTNISGADINGLKTALFADWDLQDYSKNKAWWDNANGLAYVHESAQNNLYAGIALCDASNPIHYALDKASFNGNATETDHLLDESEKYNFVSSGLGKNQAGVMGEGNDVAHFVGKQLPVLAANESRKITFILSAGNSLADLQTKIAEAKILYNQYLQNPPLLHTALTCLGTSANLNPPQGTHYEFYQDIDLTNRLFSGESYNTPVVNNTQTYYVVNVDKAYQSDIFRVRAAVDEINADFNMDQRPLLLDETGNSMVHFTDNSLGGVSWNWNFDNGFESKVQNPAMSFGTKGVYDIWFRVENGSGCQEEITKTLTVDYRSLKPEIPDQLICKGNPVTLTAPNATSLRVYTDENLNDLAFEGSAYTMPSVRENKALYITSIDSAYESNPQLVSITIQAPDTEIRFGLDTLDLQQKKLLWVDDLTENIVARDWKVNGVDQGTASSLIVNYEGMDQVNLQIITTDPIGCTDTLNQILTPTNTPAPLPQNFTVCKGSSTALEPGLGKSYYFYGDAARSQLIAKGRNLALESLNQDTTFYITAVDSLLESEAVEFAITFTNIKAAFVLDPNPVSFNQANAVTPKDTSVEAVQWTWWVEDEVLADGADPVLSFEDSGDFIITLVVADAIGCRDTTQQVLTVANITGIEDIAEMGVHIYPNPVQNDLLFMELQREAMIEMTSNQGKIVLRQALQPGKSTLGLADLADGLYMVKVLIQGKNYGQKVFINR